ncbi:MAG: GNAT family N-acetyltransferase, partial [Actinomycetota bacterium]
LTLQLAAFVSEAQLYGDPLIPPLRDDIDGIRAGIDDGACTVLVAEVVVDGAWGRAGRLVGSARLLRGEVGRVGRVVVAPDAQGLGLGSLLLDTLHEVAAREVVRATTLVTGADSERNIAFYARHGYVATGQVEDDRGVRLQVMRREAQAFGSPPHAGRPTDVR